MAYLTEYKKKLVTPEDAVKIVKSGDWLDCGSFNAQVRALDTALAKRAEELEELKIWTCFALFQSKLDEIDPTGDRFTWNSWHFSGTDRKLVRDGKKIYYSPIKYNELPRYIRERIEPIDVAMLQVGPMDKHGYFNFGPQPSHSKAVCDRARVVIVEVNENQPRCLGGFEEAIHISEVDLIVENNSPLQSISPPSVSEIDRKIAEQIIEEMSDGCCLQLGIGSIPNAVGMMIADSDLKDLGCHTEMLVDAFVSIYKAGKLNGKKKQIDPNKMVYTFAVGTQDLYDFLDDNPQCAAYPVDYSNDPFIASRNDNLISVNNALEIDLYGQCCAEASGFRQISGTGGQLDFVMAAWMSKGGKSFIAIPSVYYGENSEIKSRIVPTIAPGTIVTSTRSLIDYVVTEYGKFALKGMATWQRAEGLINIAHPEVRDDLIKAAEVQGIWRRTNKIL